MQTLDDHVPFEPGLPRSAEPLDAWLQRLDEILSIHAAAINGSEVWDDAGYDAGSFPLNSIGAVAAPARDDVETSFPGTLLFSGTADNVIANSFQMSHSWKEGSDIYPHIHWTKPAGGAGDDVTWEFYYRFYNRGAAPGAWTGPVAGVMVSNHGGVAEAEAITTFGPLAMTGRTVSQNVAWRLYRRGNTDAFAGTARLIQFDIHYLRNSSGSRKEYIK